MSTTGVAIATASCVANLATCAAMTAQMVSSTKASTTARVCHQRWHAHAKL